MERLGALRKLGLESRGATTRCTGANPSMVRYGKRATLGTLRSTSPATAADSMAGRAGTAASRQIVQQAVAQLPLILRRRRIGPKIVQQVAAQFSACVRCHCRAIPTWRLRVTRRTAR